MNTYETLVKRARRLVKQEARIPTIDWEKEAHSIKTQARKAYAMERISCTEMCRLIKMVVEADDGLD